MIVNAELLRIINAEYETRRKNAESKARAAEEYADGDPEYLAATNALNSARFDAGKARYEKNENALAEAKERIAVFGAKREKRLAALGLKPDITELSRRFALSSDEQQGKAEDEIR